jgi:nucleoside-diphosphate-sugar epimerase
MTDESPRVLITGGAGRIATKLRTNLTDYRLRLLDRNLGNGLRDNEDACAGDITDFAVVLDAVRGCDAVIHLAANPQVSASWEDLRDPNVEGTYNVFEAACRAGVRQVIFASSNHATGMLDKRQEWPIGPGHLAPDSLYGVSKVFGEALGRYYADNSEMSVICLRIGWIADRLLPDNPDWRRMWLSDADLFQLIRVCLSSDIKFGIYYGVSKNTPLRYDMEAARRDLGYVPVDDASAL